MNELVIEINNLSKKYRNILAVKNINFKINKGTIVGLLGPNGSGKSTTIGMILGLIKPSSGAVIINGQNIEKYRPMHVSRCEFLGNYYNILYIFLHQSWEI